MPLVPIMEKNTGELNTAEILLILDELVGLDMRWISFTGGNPLLREDIGQIINPAAENKIRISLNSNGSLVKEKISQMERINRISLSLDGSEDVHDFLRGAGSYNNVIEAVNTANKKNISTVLNTVISKYNLNQIDYVLDIAKQFAVKVSFSRLPFLYWARILRIRFPPRQGNIKK